MSIRIQQGPTVKITNDQLLVPDLTLADDGTIQANASQKTLIINSLQDINANDSILIGRQFFSAAYMMSNLDKNQFTLWNSNPSGESKLVAINQDGALVDSGQCSTNATGSTNTTRPESTASANPSDATTALSSPNTTAAAASSSSSLSGGIIAGIAVGSVAGAAVIAGVIVLLLRKKQQYSKASTGAVEVMSRETGQPPDMAYMYRDRKSKAGFGPSELGYRDPSELPPAGPTELPNEPPVQSFAPQELDSGYDGYRIGKAR